MSDNDLETKFKRIMLWCSIVGLLLAVCVMWYKTETYRSQDAYTELNDIKVDRIVKKFDHSSGPNEIKFDF